MFIVVLFLAMATLFLALNLIGLFNREVELGEGVFRNIDRTWDLGSFVEQEVRVFWFNGYCKSCLEKDGQPNFKKGSVYGNCFICAPFQAKNESSFFPQKGDSVKIIGKKRFGKIISYRMEKTDFAERYPDHKRSGEDKYKGAFFDALDQPSEGMSFLEAAERRAERQGKDPEQFLGELFNTKPADPSPDCLEPEDAQRANHKFANLSKKQQEHLSGCSYCAGLLCDPDAPWMNPPAQ